MPPEESALAKTLRAARAASGMTQGELATALGIGQQTVSKWETGAARPKPMVVAALAELLGLTSARILALAGYIEADASELRVEPTTSELAELADLDPEAYELVLDMARAALSRARRRQLPTPRPR